MKKRSIGSVIALAFLLACSAIAVNAQNITGSISGTVTDEKGGAVPKVAVTLTNTDQNIVVRTVTTDEQGQYVAPLLPIGRYKVTAELTGFKKAEQTGIVLNVNDKLSVNLTLQVGTVTEVVTVEANPLEVETQSAMPAGLITGTQVRELSLSARNYEQLVSMMPGVSTNGADQLYFGNSLPSGATNTVGFSINGQRNSSNSWTVDGADNVDRGSAQTLLTYPSIDAIAEFKVLRSAYDAEFGRAGAGQINVVTKSGGSGFHGNAYEFFRNDKLNANNFFNNASGVVRPPVRYNNFGYTIGGPVYIPGHYNTNKDKTFFFFSEEFNRNIQYGTVSGVVPTSAMKTGTFVDPVCVASSAGACTATSNTISTINTAAAAYIKDIFNQVPGPNSGASLISALRSVFNRRSELARVDHVFNSKLSVFGRYGHDSIPTVEPGGLFTGAALPGVSITNTNSPGYTWLIHYMYSVSSTLLNDGGFNYSYGAIISTPVGTDASVNSPDIASAVALVYKSTLGRIPAASFSGGASITGFGPYQDYNRDREIYDNVTKIIGRHTLKFGVAYHHYQKTENAGGNNTGSFSFINSPSPIAYSTTTGSTAQCENATGPFPTPTLPTCPTSFEQSFANFLLGNVSNFSQVSEDITPDIREQQIEGYAQDEFRWKSNFTLTYGLRYSWFGQPIDTKGELTSFSPAAYSAAKAPTMNANGTMCLTNTPCDPASGSIPAKVPNPNYSQTNGVIVGVGNSPYNPTITNTNYKNFAPRLGIAWDPTGHGNTSIRAGYGIFYDSTLVGTYEQNIFQNVPFVQSVAIPNTTFANPAAGTPSVSANPLVLRATALPNHTPYSQQWSLDVQRQVTKTFLVDVGYFGSNAIHLLGIVDINEVMPGVGVAAGLLTGTTIFNSTTDVKLNDYRPYLGYNAINVVENGFTSNYHSMQVSIQKRLGANSLFNLNYTLSHNLTNNQTDRSTAAQNVYDIHSEYGASQLDRRNIVTANFVYELPWLKGQEGLKGHVLGGWEASGLVSYMSGSPLTVTSSGVDPGGLGLLGSSAAGGRPDMTGDPNAYAPHKVGEFFATTAFALVPTGTIRPGDAPRGAVIGPGIERWDLSAFKNIRLASEANYLQFRVELFNAFNHTNFNGVGTAFGSSTFGVVTSAHDPRIIQLGLKFYF